MKKIFLFLVAGLLTVSCSEDSTGDVSNVTYYPELTLIGDEVIYVQKGGSFTDPGITATESGVDIPYTTTVSGDFRGGTTVDTNVVDIYRIIYSAVNQDGFSGAVARTVIVYENSDLTTSIAGLYKSTVVRNGVSSAQYTNMEYVLVWRNTDGTYGMSDGIGGYYAIGRAYGVDYAAGPVTITANDIPTNNFAPIPSFGVGAFGGVAVMSGLTANPSANTLSYTTTWDAGFTFVVTMTKVVL
ncbi:immunoglobulin-like domain-containing protein [Flavobacterium sp.]|uniref:immunoglobulin-like domain-containing protein n=1 Tax=Flavobacterium sp. TaxID=239 RepID=UPI002FDE9DDB